MESYHTEQIRENFKRLIAEQAVSIAAYEEALANFQARFDALLLTASRDTSAPRHESMRTGDGPEIYQTMLSVSYLGRFCFLGNTLSLRLLERLLRRPNQYVSYAQLQDDVWKAVRTPAAVRSVVKELRAKLRHAGMESLADAIDGHTAGHYRLTLDVTS